MYIMKVHKSQLKLLKIFRFINLTGMYNMRGKKFYHSCYEYKYCSVVIPYVNNICDSCGRTSTHTYCPYLFMKLNFLIILIILTEFHGLT